MHLAAYSDSSLEHNRLMARSRAVGKGADGLGALIFVCHEEIVQAFMAKCLEKPFARREGLIKHVWCRCKYCKIPTCKDRAALSMH